MSKVDITAVVNGHREGLLAYPTLLSLSQAAAQASRQGVKVEILLVLDRADQTTNEVFKAYCQKQSAAKILAVDYGDLGQSRNAAVRAAQGEWVAFLDADDLWGANWLSGAHDAAIRDSRAIVWHPEISLYFGVFRSIYKYADSEDRDYSIPGLALENYWSALCFTRRTLLLDIPYPDTDLRNQIGYEDWSWNLKIIAGGGLHKVVPGTGHAIRTKDISMVKQAAAAGCVPLQVPLFRNIVERRKILHATSASARPDDELVKRDAASARLDDALAQCDAAFIRADAIHASVAQLERQLAELTTAIAQKDEAEAVRALASDRSAALHRLVQWVLLRRVLLGLLRRAPNQRIATVRGQAAAMGISEVVTDPFVHWLCRRRTLLGLLRRSTWVGEAAVHGAFRASGHPHVPSDTTNYGHRYGDIGEAGMNCRLHDNETGRAEGRQPHPAGEVQSQAALTPDGRTSAAIAAFEHWLAGGLAQAAGRGKLAVSGLLLKQYFQRLGFNPAGVAAWVTLLTTACAPAAQRDLLKAIARSVQNNTHLATLTEQVRRSPVFDEAFYRNAAGLDGTDLDAALHYLLLGEPLEFQPSLAFDPHYYACRNPDIFDVGLNCLLHYETAGRSERRQPLPPSGIHTNPALLDPQRENVIVVVHEASRTGSPILGWNIVRLLAQSYNIYTIRMGEGPLTPEFEAFSVEVHGPFTGTNRHPVDMEFGLRRLFAGRAFKYAVVNSIESRRLVEVCARRSVPTVLLMHEFGSYVRPLESLQKALDLATEIVFPAPIVARSATEAHPPLLDRRVHIQPQGMSIIPSSNTAKKLPSPTQMNALLQARAKGAFIVMGAGSVIIRKGVDLFIGIAADVQRLALERPVHFLWIGHGYHPDEDMGYSVYLKEQLERSGLQDHITFMDEVSDLEPIYALAHVFLLTSRLDPLPNVSIDAAYRSIPTICFKDASGTADLMLADPDTAVGVVAHLDIGAAAELIGRLAADEPARIRLAEATGRLARTVFDMQHYVEQLDALGTATAASAARRCADGDILHADDSFDQCLFLGSDWPLIGRNEAIAQYLALADSRRSGGPNAPRAPVRRPMAGFNSWIWAAAHPTPECEHGDPLADFIRHGRPSGPWLSPVLRPTTDAAALSADGLRALLHAHLDDPDLGRELLASLRANTLACDLLVTTGDGDKAARLRQVLSGYGQGSVTVVSPRGGDSLRPILSDLVFEYAAAYDVVGHIHDGVAPVESNARNFNWQNMVGGHYAMRDVILDAFSKRSDLGVVFPSDPYLAGWGKSRPAAKKLAARLGLGETMPDAFDFPAGAMFWMRTTVLQVLLQLCSDAAAVGHNDMATDENGLQDALVRIIPFASQAAGLLQAVTHVPGVTL